MKDYTLFPIKKTDADWPLYWMVTGFVKYKRDIEDIPYHDFFEPLRDDNEQETNEYYYFFIFPSEEFGISYDVDMLNHEALILKRFSPIEYVVNSPFLTPDDPCVRPEDICRDYIPMEYFYSQDDGSGLRLLKAKSQITEGYPCWKYNGDSFMESVDELLAFMQNHQRIGTPWFERLQSVKRMFFGDANELHILHNAGLYDHATLWRWLLDSGIRLEELDDVENRYVSELKRYAMFVLNDLDWRWGTVVGETDREKKIGLYSPLRDEQIEKNNEEYNRRQVLMQGQPQRVFRKTLENKHETALMGDERENTIEAEPTSDAKQEATGVQDNKLKSKTEPEEKTAPVLPPNVFFLSEKEGIILVAALLLVIVCAVVGIIIKSIPMIAGAVAAYLAVQIVSRSKDSKHRHPSGFRFVLIILGIVMPFLFCALEYLLMNALKPTVSPELVLIIMFIITVVIVPFCINKRRFMADERKARPFSLLLLTAIMALIGSFLAYILIVTA